MLIDSHCHLSSAELFLKLPELMKRAEQVGVQYMLNAGGHFDEIAVQLEISRNYSNVFTLTGVHPHDAANYNNVTADDVLLQTKSSYVVGIGECGLDYYYDFCPKDVQIKVFKQMIYAAQLSGLPLVVHTREAENDTVDLLDEAYKKHPFKGVIHCYSSDWKLAEAVLELGFYISASGIITFKNSEQLRQSFSKIPLDRLLLETDSPYLAPVPNRGKINEPSFVIETAKCLAAIKGVDFKQISDITSKNFFTLFAKANDLITNYERSDNE